MYLSLNDAAKQARVSRATLYKRNKEGKLSFITNEAGQKGVDTAELSRLYKLHVEATDRDTATHDHLALDLWDVKLQAAQDKITLLERHIDHLQNTLQQEQSHVTKLLQTSEQLMLSRDRTPKTLKQRLKEIFRSD